MSKSKIIRQILASKHSTHLVSAGAGVGKTELLKDLVKRVRKQSPGATVLLLGSINKTLDVANERGVSAHEITNFHKFGYSLIREHSRFTVAKRYLKFAGYPCDYKLRATYDLLIDEKEQLELLTKLADENKVEAAATLEHLRFKYSGHATMLDPPLVSTYMRHKARNRCIDFNDMIILARGLLMQEPQVRKAVARQFQYICLDESQDVCKLQWEILSLIKARKTKLIAVGDPMQLAYGFLGADFHWHTRLTQKYEGDTASYRLSRSHRCPKEICELSNAITRSAKVDGKTEIYSSKSSGIKPKVIFHFENGQAVRFVVRKVLSLMKGGKKPGDIAILFRAIKTENSGKLFHLLKKELKRKKLHILYKDGSKSNVSEDCSEKIVMNTIHGFKGDGRQVIFLCGVDNQSIPFDGLATDEERAILNIAVTRSSEQLYLLCRQTYTRREGSLSSFLYPLRGSELFKERHVFKNLND